MSVHGSSTVHPPDGSAPGVRLRSQKKDEGDENEETVTTAAGTYGVER
jgi:hypothetical protein